LWHTGRALATSNVHIFIRLERLAASLRVTWMVMGHQTSL